MSARIIIFALLSRKQKFLLKVAIVPSVKDKDGIRRQRRMSSPTDTWQVSRAPGATSRQQIPHLVSDSILVIDEASGSFNAWKHPYRKSEGGPFRMAAASVLPPGLIGLCTCFGARDLSAEGL
ncbi:unnamed protein product [Nesidiocoris tenuis]|uniref:Uncharacterized protein n=1 Tax=Nesidiocoris tenuis TaxID=355587 RepID=A0A6H5H4I2_9HEMI|nr:unnamed protein product [Nesidiocoris tenuis]